MAKKKAKSFTRVIKVIKEYLSPEEPKPSGYDFGPTLEPYSTQRLQSSDSYRVASRHYADTPVPDDEEVARINRDRLEQAKLIQDKEALRLTLRSQHKLLIATLITALVALISSLTAIIISLHNKPATVYVRPEIVVKEQSK